VPALAAFAGPARIDETADGDTLSKLHFLDVGANPHHATDYFVARNAREGRHPPFVSDGMDVGMANTAPIDRDLNILPSRRTAFELKWGKWCFSRQGCISSGLHGTSIHWMPDSLSGAAVRCHIRFSVAKS
jgi:hypothetical protein